MTIWTCRTKVVWFVCFLLNSIFFPNLSVKNLWILRHTSIPWRQKMHKILIIGDLPTRRNFRVKKKFKGVSFKMSSVVFSPQHFQKSRNSCYCILKMFSNLSKKPKCNIYLSYFWMKMHTAILSILKHYMLPLVCIWLIQFKKDSSAANHIVSSRWRANKCILLLFLPLHT